MDTNDDNDTQMLSVSTEVRTKASNARKQYPNQNTVCKVLDDVFKAVYNSPRMLSPRLKGNKKIPNANHGMKNYLTQSFEMRGASESTLQ